MADRAATWSPPVPGQRRFSLTAGAIVMLLLIGLLGFYVLYPILLIFLNSFNVARPGQPEVWGLQNWAQAFASPGIRTALWNTVWLFFAHQLLSFPLAILLAWTLARTNTPWSHGLEFMFWLSFFLPSLPVTLGWILLLDPQVGLVNQWLRAALPFLQEGPFDVYTYQGIIWVHLMQNGISAKVMLLTPAFRNMDAALEEASRMSGGSNFGTLVRVTLPLMTPAIVIVALLSVLRILESFEIELLLGAPLKLFVYSTMIVNLMRSEPPLIGQATALGSLTLLLLIILVPVQRWLLGRRQYTTVTSHYRPQRIDLGRWRWPVFAAILALVGLLTVFPVVAVAVGSFMTRFGFFDLPQTWTLANWGQALGDPLFTRSLRMTLLLAAIAAVVGPLLFSLVAYVIVRTPWRGRGVLDTIVWLPTIVPGVLAGLGTLWMFVGTPFLRPTYGTLLPLLFVSILSGMTLATQITKASLLQLGRELEEASRMSGGGWWHTYRHVVLPLLAPTLVTIGVLKFMAVSQAASSLILIANSETRTLSLLTLDFMTSGLYGAATVNAIVIMALVSGVALLARRFGLRLGIQN